MKAKIIVVCGQKGGVGKTTVTMQLAGALGAQKKVLIIDADPIGASMDWYSIAKDKKQLPAIVVDSSCKDKWLHKIIKPYVYKFDYIIVDCPPRGDLLNLKWALMAADLAIIPVRPSPLDLWATVGTIKIITEVSKYNKSLIKRLLINQCQPNLTLTKTVLSVLPALKIKKLSNHLQLRTAYSQSALEGTTVHHVSGSDKKAIDEINDVSAEIQQLFLNTSAALSYDI